VLHVDDSDVDGKSLWGSLTVTIPSRPAGERQKSKSSEKSPGKGVEKSDVEKPRDPSRYWTKSRLLAVVDELATLHARLPKYDVASQWAKEFIEGKKCAMDGHCHQLHTPSGELALYTPGVWDPATKEPYLVWFPTVHNSEAEHDQLAALGKVLGLLPRLAYEQQTSVSRRRLLLELQDELADCLERFGREIEPTETDENTKPTVRRPNEKRDQWLYKLAINGRPWKNMLSALKAQSERRGWRALKSIPGVVRAVQRYAEHHGKPMPQPRKAGRPKGKRKY
jgi:hypothetical protein